MLDLDGTDFRLTHLVYWIFVKYSNFKLETLLYYSIILLTWSRQLVGESGKQGIVEFREEAKVVLLSDQRDSTIMSGDFVLCISTVGKSWEYRQIFVRRSSFCRTWGEHVVYKNCSECQKQFLYKGLSLEFYVLNL